MAQTLEVVAALANIEHGNEKNTVLETLGKEIEGFYVYKMIPQPGEYYAAVNWHGLLTDAASVAGIASLLWQIYGAHIESQPPPEPTQVTNASGKTVILKNEPSLIIQLKDKNGQFEQFKIDGNCGSREVFLQEFTEKVERLKQAGNGDEILERYERSDRWLRIK